MTKPLLTDRLRSHARRCRSEEGPPFHDIYIGKCFDEAADEIERLSSVLTRLANGVGHPWEWYQTIALSALGRRSDEPGDGRNE